MHGSGRDEEGAIDQDNVIPIEPDPEPSDPAEPTAQARRRRPRRYQGRAQPGVLGAIAAGGALGTLARYEVAQVVHVAKGSFPWATFWTNIAGSLALGFLLILLIERFPPSRYVRPFVATGFLGGFTTFSTFAVETDQLIKDGHATIGIAYALGSLFVGFAAVWVGIVLARLVPIPEAKR